jgi:hypothetical protein
MRFVQGFCSSDTSCSDTLFKTMPAYTKAMPMTLLRLQGALIPASCLQTYCIRRTLTNLHLH